MVISDCFRYKPELIIYVDSLGFETLESQGELSFKLNIEGEYKKYKSANIIGKVGNNKSSLKRDFNNSSF